MGQVIHFLQFVIDPFTVPTFNSCTKWAGKPGRIHDCTPNCRLVSWPWIHNCEAWNWQATWVTDVLGISVDMLPMSDSTIKHWQTSGRLVQELNACTVASTLLHQTNSKIVIVRTSIHTIFDWVRKFPQFTLPFFFWPASTPTPVPGIQCGLLLLAVSSRGSLSMESTRLRCREHLPAPPSGKHSCKYY